MHKKINFLNSFPNVTELSEVSNHGKVPALLQSWELYTLPTASVQGAQGQLERSSYGYCSQMIIQGPSRKVRPPKRSRMYMWVWDASGGDNVGGSAWRGVGGQASATAYSDSHRGL